MRQPAVIVVAALVTAGCVSQTTWTPTVDTYGDSRAQYVSRDLEECRQLALSASGGSGEQAVKGGAVGGLVGAAAGAAIGAAFGAAGTGAAVGAATGGIGTGAVQAVRSNEEFQRVYKNCMRNRGHRVID